MARLLLALLMMAAVHGSEPGADMNGRSDTVRDQKVFADCAALVLAGGGILGATVANTMIGLLLRIVGFATTGVVKGSFAAWWQSTMPLVQAGSVFAKLMSIAVGAGGAGTAGTTIGGLVGTAGGAGAIE